MTLMTPLDWFGIFLAAYLEGRVKPESGKELELARKQQGWRQIATVKMTRLWRTGLQDSGAAKTQDWWAPKLLPSSNLSSLPCTAASWKP
jgi:hypothetical protein